MAEAIKPEDTGNTVHFNLWGQIAQQSRKEVTQGFTYDPELVAAILRCDIDNLKQIDAGIHDGANELSFKQYDFLVRKYGLDVLKNPLLFASILLDEEMSRG